MSHTCISHGTHCDASCFILCPALLGVRDWVMSRTRRGHLSETYRTHGWVTCASPVAHMNKWKSRSESCDTYEWVMSHIWVRSRIDFTGVIEYGSELCGTLELDMSHTWVSHVTRMSDSRRTREGVISHVTRVISATYDWVMSHVWMCHVAHTWMSHVTHMRESCRTHDGVTSLVWVSHVTHEWGVAADLLG